MYRAKIGDKVKIRSLEWFNLINGNNSCNSKLGRFFPSMTKYCGKEAIITRIINYNSFKLNIDNGVWTWLGYMFEPNILQLSNTLKNRILSYCNKCPYIEYCHNNKESSICNLCNYIFYNKKILLSVGDTVKIRTLEWTNVVFYQGERFIYLPKKYKDYLGKKAIITNVINESEPLYELNIDNGKFKWSNYLFEENFIEYKIRKEINEMCSKSMCIYECSRDTCPLFSFSINSKNE